MNIVANLTPHIGTQLKKPITILRAAYLHAFYLSK